MSKLRNRFVPSAASGSSTTTTTTIVTTLEEEEEQQQQQHQHQQQEHQVEQTSNDSSDKQTAFLSSCLSNASAPTSTTVGGVASSLLPPKGEQIQQHPAAVVLLGFDISKFTRRTQFCVCTSGVFFFYLFYGYLQELLQVHVCNRQYGLFLTAAQFAGYTAWSFLFRQYSHYYCCREQQEKNQSIHDKSSYKSSGITQSTKTTKATTTDKRNTTTSKIDITGITEQASSVPILLYIGLSVLRAIDLSMTNMSMQYVNFPTKTLMKSSRVVFTMLFGILLANKRYKMREYVLVICMIGGLALFLHADSKVSAVFEPIGIVMLVASLTCDGLLTNVTERMMRQYGVGQDEYIYRMHSIALLAICSAAAWTGDLMDGIQFMTQPGTHHETTTSSAAAMRLLLQEGDLGNAIDPSTAEVAAATMTPSWSVSQKWLVLIGCFTMGFLGNSCSGAITKNFGALAMTITSTARMATTLFLSFMLFAENTCTVEHVAGILVFCVTARQLWLGV